MNQEHCIRLIKLYEKYRILWDPKNSYYLNKHKREDCWRKIAKELPFSVAELKKKMESLLGSYRREKSRVKKTRCTGSGTDDAYVSKWFGYHYFDFMANKNYPGDATDAMQNDQSQPSAHTFESYSTRPEMDAERSMQTRTNEEQSERQGDTDRAQQSQEHMEVPPQLLPSFQQSSRKKRRVTPGQALNDSQFPPSESVMLALAFKTLQKTSVNDSYISFGNYVASELRKYDQHTLACVKNAINNIIYEADMGKYQNYQSGYFTQHYASTSAATTPIPKASPTSSVSTGSPSVPTPTL